MININSLREAARTVEEKQSLTVWQKAEQANVRAIELLWSTLVFKYHSHRPSTFTGMERQAIRNLTAGYGIHNLLLYLTETVKSWTTLRSDRQFSSFPQVPTFQIFLHFHRLITPLIDIHQVKKIEERERLAAKQ